MKRMYSRDIKHNMLDVWPWQAMQPGVFFGAVHRGTPLS